MAHLISGLSRQEYHRRRLRISTNEIEPSEEDCTADDSPADFTANNSARDQGRLNTRQSPERLISVHPSLNSSNVVKHKPSLRSGANEGSDAS